MRIGFVTLPVSGHLNPMTSLARKLQDRGHEIVFFGIPDAALPVRAAGLPFCAYLEEEYPPGSMAKQLTQLSVLSGQAALKFTMELLRTTCRAALKGGASVFERSGVQALAIDAASRGFDSVAIAMSLPYVTISNSLHTDLRGDTPICIFNWLPEGGPEARARNLGGLKAFNEFARPVKELQMAYLKDAGVAVDESDPYPLYSKRAWITQCLKELDFPNAHWPAYFHHAGPFLDTNGRAPIPFPWERLTGEPLIYASMGTLQNGSEKVFHLIASAAASPGHQIVLSIGPNLSTNKFESLPENTIVVNRAPQIEILKRAALCITHGGLNTVLESLAQGVPMVVIPVTNDQPGVAARVTFSSTGRMLPLRDLNVESLRSLVDEVMHTTSFHENALRLRKAIDETRGLEKAATLIERAFGVLAAQAGA